MGVGQIEAIDKVLETLCLVQQCRQVRTFGWIEFTGDNKLARSEYVFEILQWTGSGLVVRGARSLK